MNCLQKHKKSVRDVIFLTVFTLLTTMVVISLNRLNRRTNESITASLRISNLNQCELIASHMTLTQWNADNYALYMLQPKHYKKTYKELVVSDIPYKLPAKISLSTEVKFELALYNNKYVVLNKDNTYETCYDVVNTDTCVVIPIYHHRVIVAELYVFFDNIDDVTIFVNSIDSRIIEAQSLGKLIY